MYGFIQLVGSEFTECKAVLLRPEIPDGGSSANQFVGSLSLFRYHFNYLLS